MIGLAVSATITVLLGLWGAARLRGNRVAAFRLLNTALLVDILFGQVFAFAMNQFFVIPRLAADLLLLAVISADCARRTDRAAGPSGRRVDRAAGLIGR